MECDKILDFKEHHTGVGKPTKRREADPDSSDSVLMKYLEFHSGSELKARRVVDAIRNLFRDPIEHAINEGLKPGGDLAKEIEDLGYDYVDAITALNS